MPRDEDGLDEAGAQRVTTKKKPAKPKTSGAEALLSAVAQYHAGVLRAVGTQSGSIRDVRMAKKSEMATDIGGFGGAEMVMSARAATVAPPPRPTSTPDPARDLYATTFERLRELVGQATLDPYSKEVVYGFPLLVGALPNPKGRGLRAVCSPLFMQTVSTSTEVDGSLSLRAVDEPPRFNTSLWQGTVSASQQKAIIEYGLDAQADLAAAFSLDRINQLIDALRSILPFIDGPLPGPDLVAWPEPERNPSVEHLEVVPGAAAFLTNRSSLYLLHDLEQIRRGAKGFLKDEESPLALLTCPASSESRTDLRSPREDEVVFPFASNGPQRRVVDALDKNRLVVVQGPPGTGKSQTIANLVAHLVANGQRVLVTSHKQQALTVVRDKLSEIRARGSDQPLRFLFAALVGSDGEAKRALRHDIETVRAFAAKAQTDELAKQLKSIEQRRRKNADAFAAAEDDFESRALDDQAEAASLWESFGLQPVPPIADPPVPAERRADIATALDRLDARARSSAAGIQSLAEWEVDATKDLRQFQEGLRSFVAHQRLRIDVSASADATALVDEWRPVAERSGAGSVASADAAVAVARNEFIPALIDAESASSQGDGAERIRSASAALADLPELIPSLEEDVAAAESLLTSARSLASSRDVVPAPPEQRATISTQYDTFLDGGVFAKRTARKWLDESAPGVRGIPRESVGAWRAFWDAWLEARTRISTLGGSLGVDLPEEYAPDAAVRALAEAQRAVRLANATVSVRQAIGATAIPIPAPVLVQAESAPGAQEVLDQWALALTAVKADADGGVLIDHLAMAPARDVLRAIDAAVDAGDGDRVVPDLETLEVAADAIDDYRECARLLNGPLDVVPAAADAVYSAAVAGDAPPPFLADAEAAFERHELAHAFRELADRDTTDVVASRAQDGRSKVIEDAAAVLELRIQARIMEAFRKPSFLASLQAFRKAMNASAKRFETFEALKTSPEVDPNVLTDAFPCWIMRPDDVCRIFRLAPDTFDVVIFDEASQCNPDVALPLFARANKVVLFGDDKQLSNEDLKITLSSAQNQALRRQADLDPLDPAGLFDEMRASLLELVAHRQQAQVMLDEHFRCRPEIVAFSNRQFYGNTLLIVRDKEDSWGVGPPILIRQVEDAPAMGKSKINHAEADALIADLAVRLRDPLYSGMSFGVLSLFRDQIEYIRDRVASEIPRALADEHRLICATVDGFQGDERDVIYYSWRFGRDTSPSIFSFTQGATGSQRVNVALTRARHQMIHFISRPVNEFPVGQANVTGFLRHALDPGELIGEMEGHFFAEPSCRAREVLREALEGVGLDVEEDFPIAGTRIDLLVKDPDTGARVAVFCDAQGALLRPADAPSRIASHALLARAGWTIRRAPATRVLDAPEQVVTDIQKAIGKAAGIATTESDEPHVATVHATAAGWTAAQPSSAPATLAPEDLADYPWDPPPAHRRIAAGDVVFMSDFERDLFDELSAVGDLQVVPQWPSCGKMIDLVITDREGRRLAVEADGDVFHQTRDGEMIPEDAQREEVLRAAGWEFHRVLFTDWGRDREAELKRLLDALGQQAANPELAALVWADADAAAEPLAADIPSREVAAVPVPPQGDVEAAPEQADDEQAGVEEDGSSAAAPELDGAAAELAPAEDLRPPAPAAPAGNPAAGAFEAVDLGEFPLRAGLIVAANEGIAHDDLVDSVAAALGAPDPPKNYRRLVGSLIWSAAGRKIIADDDGRWVRGTRPPAADRKLHGWSLQRIAQAARETAGEYSSEEEHFVAMCELVNGGPGRVSKPASRAIGIGMRIAAQESAPAA